MTADIVRYSYNTIAQAITSDTLFWLYSTIAQTLGGILGIGGLICVFKLGNLRDGRWKILDRLSIFTRYVIGDVAPSAKELLKQCQPLLEKSTKSFELHGKSILVELDYVTIKDTAIPDFDPRTNVKADFSQLDAIVKSEATLRPLFIRFVWTNLVVIAVSVVLLIFCKPLASKSPWIRIIASFSIVVAVVYCLTFTYRLFIRIIPRGE